VYERLWRRAALPVTVEVVASIAFRFIDPIRWFPTDPDTPLTDALLGIVLLQRPGVMGGILVLCAIILGALRAVFELRRHAGDLSLVALSLGLYLVACATGPLRWPPGETRSSPLPT
jgi:hypothetical protein